MILVQRRMSSAKFTSRQAQLRLQDLLGYKKRQEQVVPSILRYSPTPVNENHLRCKCKETREEATGLSSQNRMLATSSKTSRPMVAVTAAAQICSPASTASASRPSATSGLGAPGTDPPVTSTRPSPSTSIACSASLGARWAPRTPSPASCSRRAARARHLHPPPQSSQHRVILPLRPLTYGARPLRRWLTGSTEAAGRPRRAGTTPSTTTGPSGPPTTPRPRPSPHLWTHTAVAPSCEASGRGLPRRSEGLARAAKVGRCHKRYELKTGRNEPLARLGPGTAEARRARSRPAPKRKMAPNVDVPLFGYCGALESENHSASLFTPCKTQCEPCSAICNLEK